LQTKLEPISQPQVDILKIAQGNPFLFRASFFVLPEINLPDYREIAGKIKKSEKPEQILERREEILQEIEKKSDFEIPDILIEAEKQRMLRVLAQIKTAESEPEKQILDNIQTQSRKNAKRFLILREISKKENIQVDNKEIEQELDKVVKQYPDADKSKIDRGRLKEYIKEQIKNQQTLKLIENL